MKIAIRLLTICMLLTTLAGACHAQMDSKMSMMKPMKHHMMMKKHMMMKHHMMMKKHMMMGGDSMKPKM